MMYTIPELCRKRAVESLFKTSTMIKAWRIWKPKIMRLIGDNPNSNNILNLGDNLHDIFKSTGIPGRSQSTVSGGGIAWESLICWYINLCCSGSRIVAFRKMSEVPKAIQDSITVNYGNFACNTESDITIVIFPNIEEYTSNIDTLEVLNDEGQIINPINKGSINNEIINVLCVRDFPSYEIGIIQCKTNWNDNAQIPMLWDMIYSANGFKDRNISIGRNGFNIHDSKNFTYAFITVPTVKVEQIKQSSVSVKRVYNLSGGNYWGLSSSDGIARSVKEIFSNNYSNGFDSPIRETISNSINYYKNLLSYFDII